MAIGLRTLNGMAMGKRPAARQGSPMWVNKADLPKSSGHPFFEYLNRILTDSGFDAFVERLCSTFCADRLGRLSLRPGRYSRLLFTGYFEGLSSERGIATLPETLTEAAEQVGAVQPEGSAVAEVMADKGYHRDKVLLGLISEPPRGPAAGRTSELGRFRRRSVLRSRRCAGTVDGSAANAVVDWNAGAGNWWSARSLTSTRPAGYGGCGCAATRISASGCSSRRRAATSGSSCAA